jgi:MYXO-CTERM domain-containing protein
MNTRIRILPALAVAVPLAMGLGLLTGAPPSAEAFCGFYVAGADTKLFNDATMVVLMRDGKRTVLAMQNDYQGPPEDFAMVVPVPVVLTEDNVKTLPKEVFDRVDKLASPRLVEYWEEDPCAPRHEYDTKGRGGAIPAPMPAGMEGAGPHGVKIEAQFTVAEYEIVILSASDSTGLDAWLRENKYKIPEGAEPLLRPYVEDGMKFFVAKVDTAKVTFASQPDGSKRATLSPLRFHYDSDQFALPIRLGLINAPAGGADGKPGSQDLLVHILGRNTRYQVANYPNATIPTNLEVKDETRERFGQFYVSLFDHTLEKHPKAVITEYAWAANSCDPCPEPALSLSELVTLGADVLPSYADQLGQQPPEGFDPGLEWSIPSEFVLTRLHARYDKNGLGEDLVFEEAPSIAGGREFLQADGQLERGAVPFSSNMFQARYIIRHPWTGPIACEKPERGVWGGPPSGGEPGPVIARKLATVDRSATLASFTTAQSHAILELAGPAPDQPTTPAGDDTGSKQPDGDDKAGDDKAGDAKADPGPDEKQADDKAGGKGCTCEVDERSAGGLGLFSLFGLLTLAGLRRPRETSKP